MDKRMENAPCGFLSLDGQGFIHEVNRVFREMTGFSQAELAGRHLESLMTVASKMLFHSLFFPQLKLNGRVDELYLTLLGKEGAEVPVLLMGSADAEGDTIDCMAARMTRRVSYEQELRAAEKKLESAYLRETGLRKLLETTILSINEGIIVTDRLAHITVINDLAAEYIGLSVEEAVGADFYDVFHCADSASRLPHGFIRQIFAAGHSRATLDDLTLLSHDGTQRHIMGTAAPLRSEEDASIAGVVVSFRDITREYLQDKEIDGFLNVNMDMLCVLTAHGAFHRVNRKFTEVLGFSAEELEGRDFLSIVHPDDTAATHEAILASSHGNAPCRFTNRCRRYDGAYRYIEWERQPGAGDFTYSSARDVTDGKSKEAHLLDMAVRDQLTGLYNRHYLEAWLEQTEKEPGAQPLTMAILDLDHFKRVNDTWGHPVGDELLQLTARTIGENIRSGDLLVRFGGEEFIVILPHTDRAAAAAALEHVRKAVESSLHPTAGRQTVSIGAAQRGEEEAFLPWYERADEALYRAKQTGRNRVCLASEADECEQLS